MSNLVSRGAVAWALMSVGNPIAASDGHGATTPAPAPQQAEGAQAALARSPLVYVVRYRPGSAYRLERPLLRQELRQHAAYMRSQTDAGVIIAAGPTFDQVGGLVLLSAADLAEAEAFVRNDPAVIAGTFVGEITDWRPLFDGKSIFKRQARAAPAPCSHDPARCSSRPAFVHWRASGPICS